MVGTAAVVVGLVLALGFGIWLAILRVAFAPWDGWVIAAIVLWAIATVLIVALVRGVCEAGQEGEGAHRLRGERAERRVGGVESHLDWAVTAGSGVGSDRRDRHRHDL